MSRDDLAPDTTAPTAPGGHRASAARHGSLAGLLALATAVQALATFAILALPTLSLAAAATFGIGAQAVGYQLSLVYFVAAWLASFSGLLVRRWGAAATSIAALGLSGTGLLCLASGRFAVTALGSILVGAAYGMINPAASHLLFRFSPPARRNLVFAIKQSGVPIGGILAALLLPTLALSIGWQAAMAGCAVLHVLLLPPLLWRRAAWDDDRDGDARLHGGVLAGVRTMLAHPLLRRLGVMGACFASYQFCVMAFAINMLSGDLGWSLVAAGSAATLMQLGGAIGRVAWGWIADRTGRGLEVLAFIGIAATLLGAGIGIAATRLPPFALIALLVVFGFCIVGWNGVYMAAAAKAADPKEVGLATGGVLAFNFSGVVVGPTLFALTYGLTGSYAATFGLFAILPLLGALQLIGPLRGMGPD